MAGQSPAAATSDPECGADGEKKDEDDDADQKTGIVGQTSWNWGR